MPKMRVTNKDININEQGYLLRLEDWSEAYVKKIAKQDNIKLYNDHWEIIFYFREYFHENQVTPTMHQMIVGLMSKNKKFLEKKNMKGMFTVFSHQILFVKSVN